MKFKFLQHRYHHCNASTLLVTFVWWAKGFSNVSSFHWATLRFSHSNSSNIVVKCSFFWLFPASCISRSVALHDLFDFFTIANALFTHNTGAVWKTFTTNCNTCTKQPERFQPTNASWWSFSHIKVIYFRTSPLFNFILLSLEIIPRFLLV